MKFEIIIEETISQKFVINASNAEEAMEQAKDLYHKGHIVLDQANLIHKQMACVTAGETTEWEEF